MSKNTKINNKSLYIRIKPPDFTK